MRKLDQFYDLLRLDFFPSWEEAQELMDMLWSCGLRPTQGKSSIGQLEAVERHLADMRAIAFNKLEIKPC